MLQPFRHADFSAMAELWNRQYPAKYRIDADLLRINTVDSPLFDWGASTLLVDDDAYLRGFVAIKRSSALAYPGPDPDQAHVTALVYPDSTAGVDLLAYAKRLLRARGIHRLVFGQDLRHFFPGCPSECPALRDFLMVEGFEEGHDQFDMRHDLAAYEPPCSVLPDQVKPARPEDVPALENFLRRVFPGRWTHDTLAKIQAEGRADFVYLLWFEGEVAGFAITQDASHQLLIAGAVWRNELGPNWCSLGPIGVGPEVRGKGLGDALLATTLQGLKDRGGRECIIDWTNLVSWYGKHGFRPENHYRPFSLRLDHR